MGNREKRNKKQKHTETFAHVWLWNIEKKLKRKSPYIEDKKKKRVLKPWISCGCHEKQ